MKQKLKNFIKKKRIYLKNYDVTIYLLCPTNYDKAFHSCYPTGVLSKDSIACCIYETAPIFYLIFSENSFSTISGHTITALDFETISHECFHLTHRILKFKKKSFLINNENRHEEFAQLNGLLNYHVVNWIQDHNLETLKEKQELDRLLKKYQLEISKIVVN